MANVRAITTSDKAQQQLVYAVWEVTLRCDHACAHCGSRADKPRPDELTREEMLKTADELVALGCREVTLIGGEAYLRPELPELVARMAEGGIKVTMQTGGMGLTLKRCHQLKEAGLRAIGVSIDGPERAHDVLRARPGSWRAATRALRNAKEAGFVTASNLQVNRLTKDHLWEHAETMRELGVQTWRGQTTVPMGNAADRPEWLLQPWEVLEAVDTLAAIQEDELKRTEAAGLPPSKAIHITLGNNLGYFGPHEELLRSRPGGTSSYYSGCPAGSHVIGIESDGAVKGCPSLPTHPYVGGNVRETSLAEMWATNEVIGFTRGRGTEELWGFCKGCYYASVCRGGCSWSAHVTLGRRGNQPWCYHRAQTLKEQGKRERLVRVQAPEGIPYDYGLFELVEEPWDASDEASST